HTHTHTHTHTHANTHTHSHTHTHTRMPDALEDLKQAVFSLTEAAANERLLLSICRRVGGHQPQPSTFAANCYLALVHATTWWSVEVTSGARQSPRCGHAWASGGSSSSRHLGSRPPLVVHFQ